MTQAEIDRLVKANTEMFRALHDIAHYDSPERLQRTSEKRYGLDYAEALEMAYENVISEAREALKRLPRQRRKSSEPAKARVEVEEGAGDV